jgi:hypothetical protein
VGALLGQQFRAAVGAQETDLALGGHLRRDRAAGERGQVVADLHRDRTGRRGLVEQRARQRREHGPAQPRPDPYGVRAPRLDAQRLLSAAPLQRAVALGEGAHGGG